MRGYTESGHEKIQLNLSKIEMLDVIDSIIHDKDIYLDMMLEPGDIQFANNYTVLYSRTSFEEFDDAAQKRH